VGVTQYFKVGKKTKDGLVPMRLAYAVAYCDRCGETSELVKVHELELCPKCAELYGKQYQTFVKVFMEKEETKGKKK